MSTKNILWWLLFLLGEALIISAFILFGDHSATSILTLNMVVSSIIYGSFFFAYGSPWIDKKDGSQPQVGSMGITWYTTGLYSSFAIAAMLICNVVFELQFPIQLFIHIALLFLLLFSILLARQAADKVSEVYNIESENRNGIAEMRRAMGALKDKISETSDLPNTFIQRIDALEESLRFISPTESQEARDLEHSFVKTINEVRIALSDFSMNEGRIESNLSKCERIYQNRKNIYSN